MRKIEICKLRLLHGSVCSVSTALPVNTDAALPTRLLCHILVSIRGLPGVAPSADEETEAWRVQPSMLCSKPPVFSFTIKQEVSSVQSPVTF